MIHFFQSGNNKYYALESDGRLTAEDIKKLCWLLGNASWTEQEILSGFFLGPRKEMLTPWSTNAVEITQNMGIKGISRIEEFYKVSKINALHDKMLQVVYTDLDQDIFLIVHAPEAIRLVDDIQSYNESEGLALSADEVKYLDELSKQLGRQLTDSEIFGFSQVNSEHCRHKIFNGRFIINGKEMEESLFQLIKKTSKRNPQNIVSAYSDNVAFIKGPVIEQFAPATQDKSDYFRIKDILSVISMKAETHNFPTTVEPFNGAATGSGGEIRDRMAGGKGSIPLVGTAVYMTSYPRLDSSRIWEEAIEPRDWRYQSPEEILIKASNGASDFGNKFGQPLICGSVLTYEHYENQKLHAFDKVIMLAGGVGFANNKDAHKAKPEIGDRLIVMGGDNYRIGMGGGAVSSVATGEFGNQIELNAIQRSNPEMQKRVFNAIRAMAESDSNPIVSIHDHGAGGHLNSLSELVEASGGHIDISKLPVGDPTLSFKEIIGNESQERMGLIVKPENLPLLQNIASRERAPIYNVGKITGDHRFIVENTPTSEKPVNLKLEDMFGKPPVTVLIDEKQTEKRNPILYESIKLYEYLDQVLQLEAVGCKDWLTNKVDRSVTGRVALQQTAGSIQLPLNNLGVVSLDYKGEKGIATSIGHAAAAALIDPAIGSRISVAEALTNIVWTPIEDGLDGLSLSANWMWPAKQAGEDARLYEAVKALSDFAIELGISVPTGKDSLSMTQKYPDGKMVYSPGTVIVSATGQASNIRKSVTPVLKAKTGSEIFYIDLSGDEFHLGGSSFAQILNLLGNNTPDIKDAGYLKKVFNTIQLAIENDLILAGHDVSAGGLITALLEMCFAEPNTGMLLNLNGLEESDIIKVLFAERPSLLVQVNQTEDFTKLLTDNNIKFSIIGKVVNERKMTVQLGDKNFSFSIDQLRDTWYLTSSRLDSKQCGISNAAERFANYPKQQLTYNFPAGFTGEARSFGINTARRTSSGVKAAIIREKGVNGDREMAYSLYYSGFDVKDVHMTDLISGKENLDDINMIVFVGGFSNSDVLGSAKGWAGAFLYNDTARQTLERFYARKDTLSLGICNGCQVMIELGLIYPDHDLKPIMKHNKSGKFESGFINVDIPENESIMFKSLAGTRLGVWVAHGEGRFFLPKERKDYNFAAHYTFTTLPGNPNGSDFNTAALVSDCGRHLAMMPHIERSLFPWQWANYPDGRKNDQVSPWIEAFVNARKWVEAHL